MKNPNGIQKVLVTGGAGYVGAVLVPRLLRLGYNVKVLDLYIYGEHVLDQVKNHPNLKQIKGDIRDTAVLRKCIAGCDCVIHLACISNDPSVELDPRLSQTINYAAFGPLVAISKENGIRRFIFASSGSIYGISNAEEVTEEHLLVPVSLYNKYKSMCEHILLDAQSQDLITVIIRPGTICGYSPRQRLDLTVNIMTTHGFYNARIKVFGGKQMRPNIHMQDMVDIYSMLLEVPDEHIAGEVFNAANENYTVAQTAAEVKRVISTEMDGKRNIEILIKPSRDPRSYHISSEKMKRQLGFVAKRSIHDGVRDLVNAFKSGIIPNALDDSRYYNVNMMKRIRLK